MQNYSDIYNRTLKAYYDKTKNYISHAVQIVAYLIKIIIYSNTDYNKAGQHVCHAWWDASIRYLRVYGDGGGAIAIWVTVSVTVILQGRRRHTGEQAHNVDSLDSVLCAHCSRCLDKRPPDKRPPDKRPPDKRPPDKRPQDKRPPDTRPQDKRPPDKRPPDKRPPDKRPPDTRPQDKRPPDKRPPDKRPPDKRPPDKRPPDKRPPDTRPPDKRSPDKRPPDISPPDKINYFKIIPDRSYQKETLMVLSFDITSESSANGPPE